MEVEKYWLVELVRILHYSLLFKEKKIFAYNVILCNNSKLGDLVKFTLLKHWLFWLIHVLFLLFSLGLFSLLFLLLELLPLFIRLLLIRILFRILWDKIFHITLLIIWPFYFLIVFSFQKFVCLDCQHFTIWIFRQQFVELVTDRY